MVRFVLYENRIALVTLYKQTICILIFLKKERRNLFLTEHQGCKIGNVECKQNVLTLKNSFVVHETVYPIRVAVLRTHSAVPLG